MHRRQLLLPAKRRAGQTSHQRVQLATCFNSGLAGSPKRIGEMSMQPIQSFHLMIAHLSSGC